jgi:hypothetical protein
VRARGREDAAAGETAWSAMPGELDGRCQLEQSAAWRWCEGAAERGKARVIRVDKERERRWRGLGLECSRCTNGAANRRGRVCVMGRKGPAVMSRTPVVLVGS